MVRPNDIQPGYHDLRQPRLDSEPFTPSGVGGEVGRVMEMDGFVGFKNPPEIYVPQIRIFEKTNRTHYFWFLC